MWALTFTYNQLVDEDTLVAWGDELDERDGSVAAIPGYGFTVTLHETGPDPIKALMNGRRTASFIPHSPVGISVVDEEIYEANAFAPTVPEILSAVEAPTSSACRGSECISSTATIPGSPLPCTSCALVPCGLDRQSSGSRRCGSGSPAVRSQRHARSTEVMGGREPKGLREICMSTAGSDCAR